MLVCTHIHILTLHKYIHSYPHTNSVCSIEKLSLEVLVLILSGFFSVFCYSCKQNLSNSICDHVVLSSSIIAIMIVIFIWKLNYDNDNDFAVRNFSPTASFRNELLHKSQCSDFFCVPHLCLLGLPFLVRFFAYVTGFFFIQPLRKSHSVFVDGACWVCFCYRHSPVQDTDVRLC